MGRDVLSFQNLVNIQCFENNLILIILIILNTPATTMSDLIRTANGILQTHNYKTLKMCKNLF